MNGGTATTFTQDGSDTLAGSNTVTVPSGSYSVVEDALPIAGYGTTYDDCSGTIAADGTATCTITNNDSPPVCNAADTTGDAANAAYNNIPKDAVDCGPPSQAFEATSTKEFGDEVALGKSGNSSR